MNKDDVLIVEDDDDIREEVASLFADEGYAVTQAANGADALATLAGPARPCVILLDLMMPVMDGWDFRSRQLSDPSLADIPVIVVSGVNDVKDAAESLRAAGYVKKPYDVNVLLETVRHHCACSNATPQSH